MKKSLKYVVLGALLIVSFAGFKMLAGSRAAAPGNSAAPAPKVKTAEDIERERQIAAHRETLKNNAKDTHALIEVGSLEGERGQNREAQQALNRALAVDPADEYALRLMGDTYAREKNYSQAIKYYKQVLSINDGMNTNGVVACLGLYRVYMAQNNKKDADAVIKKAYSLTTDPATREDIRKTAASGGR